MTKEKDLKDLIIEGIHERKGHNVTVVDLSHIDTAAADTFIIAEGNSTMQVSSIADSVEEYVRVNGNMKPYNEDGLRNAEWIVMDYGSVWAHIFLPETRQHYNLEELWSDANITQIPDLD
jgi:ribosome-associated protein